MKKALNFIIGTIILTIAVIGITVGCGFVDFSEEKTILTLLRVAEVVTIVASVFLLLGCLFGKMAGNKHLTLAFWINIGVIVMNIVVFIIDIANIQSRGLIVAFNVINTLVSLVTYDFVILGCKEAVPALKKLAITCAVFITVGYILMGVLDCLKDQTSDPAVAVGVFGGLFFLTGCILFVILVAKARAKVTD